MMKTTSRLMACPLCLDCVSATFGDTHRGINRGETIRRAYDCWHDVAGRNVAALPCDRRRPAADPSKFHFPFAAAKTGPIARRNSAHTVFDGSGSKLFTDHAIDGATPGAAEEDRRIEDRQQQRELPAAARAREEISVACVPIGHNRHLHGEHERKRTREESHGERRATKKLQNAEKVGPPQRRREAERRQDILRHRPGEAAEELHIAVIDDDRSCAETDDGVAVGRNALVEPAEGGKYQPLRVDGTFRARVHCFLPFGFRDYELGKGYIDTPLIPAKAESRRHWGPAFRGERSLVLSFAARTVAFGRRFARGFYTLRVPRSSACGRSTVRMSTSDVSVRWTGHLSAISKSRRRCSASSAPRNVMARSMRSIIPSLVSQSSQSAAWMRAWLSSTVTRSSGSALRSA